VERIGCQRTTERLGIHLSATADRMLLGFEDKHARTLPEYEPITLSIERP
jgi:hypothetical protein